MGTQRHRDLFESCRHAGSTPSKLAMTPSEADTPHPCDSEPSAVQRTGHTEAIHTYPDSTPPCRQTRELAGQVTGAPWPQGPVRGLAQGLTWGLLASSM